MSECRVYSEPPWMVVVTHQDGNPAALEQLTVRCAMPGCGGSFKWLQNTYGYYQAPVLLTKTTSGPACLAAFQVCECTRKQYRIEHGVCPPWFTKEEKVAWLLQP